MGSLFKRLRKLFSKQNKQTTFVYCPKCGLELCKNGHFISDHNGLVTYKCANCGTHSQWDFCPPVPLLLDKKYSPEE